MQKDPAVEMKARMRLDLVEAMKGRRSTETATLRSLLAAIDNAEAPEIGTAASTHVSLAFGGSNEVDRLTLTPDEIRQVLLEEIRDREQAAGQLAELGQSERADLLLAQAAIARRYIE